MLSREGRSQALDRIPPKSGKFGSHRSHSGPKPPAAEHPRLLAFPTTGGKRTPETSGHLAYLVRTLHIDFLHIMFRSAAGLSCRSTYSRASTIVHKGIRRSRRTVCSHRTSHVNCGPLARKPSVCRPSARRISNSPLGRCLNWGRLRTVRFLEGLGGKLPF